ncbi:MAG: hypothetical protein ACYDAO_09450 [Thermoplasmataceae archaeon]
MNYGIEANHEKTPKEDYLQEQVSLVRKFSIFLMISGTLGGVYTLFSGHSYYGVFYALTLGPPSPTLTLKTPSNLFIAYGALIASFAILSVSTFYLSKLFKKKYFKKKYGTVALGLMYLLSVLSIFIIFLTILTLANLLEGYSQHPPPLIEAIILSPLIVIAWVFFFSIFIFPFGIFFSIVSFANRTKRPYFIILALLSAPGIYYLPVIAGIFGYFITFGDYSTEMAFYRDSINILKEGINTLKGEIIKNTNELRDRISKINRDKYRKYSYPALFISMFATVLCLYFSFTFVPDIFEGAVMYYYDPYLHGTYGILIILGDIMLPTFDIAFLGYATNSKKISVMAFFIIYTLFFGADFYLSGLLPWVKFTDKENVPIMFSSVFFYFFMSFYMSFFSLLFPDINKRSRKKKSDVAVIAYHLREFKNEDLNDKSRK